MPEHLVRFLRSLYAAPADGVSDAELLRRCAAGKDDAAFELLVRRHAGLVWRVCRSVARDHHAAEDAFQAAFLALARRPGAVRDPSAAGWLSRVAYHAALKSRGRIADTPLSVDPTSSAAGPADSAERSEVGMVLHAELDRLPEKYRLPVVLCHLHGFTQQDAAAQLGLPVGTVATQVRRGLDRLRNQLTRRGVALPATGGLLAAPPALTEAAVRVAASTVPGHITRLSEGALAAMNPVRWKVPAAAALVAAALGTAWAVGQAAPDDKPTPPARPAAAVPAKKAAAPSTYTQRERSRKALQRVAFAVHDYADAHGHLPTDILGKDGKPLLSWRVAILPQLDNEFLYSQFKIDEPWDSEHNRKLLPHMPKAFRSPVQGPGPQSETYFQGFAGPGAGFEAGKKLGFMDFADGTSNTMMLAEAGPLVPWTKPVDRPYDPKKPLPAMDGPYSDRFITVFWDGSPHDLRWNLNEESYRHLIERADGKIAFGFYEGAANPTSAPPQTDEDRKLIEESRKWVTRRVRSIQEEETERQKLLDELKKTGSVPEPPGLGPDASVEDWKALEQRLQRRERLLWDEIEWLRKELEKRKREDKK